tara:strand:+ start:639 stop:1376 length:738 start_codon:yes stop_codon:yes gene_type:complete
MKKSLSPVDKSFVLNRPTPPLSFMLSSRHTRRNPLLYFDGTSNKPLRYARNQKSPFEDEQDGTAIVEPIIFDDGFLHVPKENPVLQEFLSYHPGFGDVFKEVNKEKDAKVEVESLNAEVDALIAARGLTLEMLENISRVLLGSSVDKMTTSELKRDVLVFAKQNPFEFLDLLNDPMLELESKVAKFFEDGILGMRNNNKDVYFNLAKNKTKMLTVPFGESANYIVASYLQSDDGIETLKILEKQK